MRVCVCMYVCERDLSEIVRRQLFESLSRSRGLVGCELYDQGFNQEVHQAQKAKDTMDSKKRGYRQAHGMTHACTAMRSFFSQRHAMDHTLPFPKVSFRIQLGRINTSSFAF